MDGVARHWEGYVSDRDLAVFAAAGFGERGGLGSVPAVLVVDMTYGFCGDRPEPILDSIVRWRASCGEAAWDAIPHIRQVCEIARDRGVPVLGTKGIPAPTGAMSHGNWAAKNPRRHEDRAEATEILPEIASLIDMEIAKEKPSAFFATPLLSYLVKLKVDSLIVCGSTTSGCVRASVVDAFSYNYRVAVVAEGSFDRSASSHAVSLLDMHMKYADVMATTDVVAYLSGIQSDVSSDRLSTLPNT